MQLRIDVGLRFAVQKDKPMAHVVKKLAVDHPPRVVAFLDKRVDLRVFPVRNRSLAIAGTDAKFDGDHVCCVLLVVEFVLRRSA